MADFSSLFQTTFKEACAEKERKEELARKAAEEATRVRKEKERIRKDLVWNTYFPKVIDCSNKNCLQGALLQSAKSACRCLYFNFNRNDFEGWDKLVDGGYKNAKPTHILHQLLTGAKLDGEIPENVSWDIWNNGAFTVLFTW